MDVLDNAGKLCNTGTIYANGLLRSFLTVNAILSRLMFPARLLFCGKLDILSVSLLSPSGDPGIGLV